MSDAKQSNSSRVFLGMRDTVKISASPDGRGTHTFVCVFVWIPVILLQWSPSLVSPRSQMNCRVKLWEKHLRQLSLLILPTAGPQEKGKKIRRFKSCQNEKLCV